MLRLTMYRIGDARHPGEGLRLGTVRYLPRGVPKEEYARRDLFDVWLPVLAPSRELLKWIGPPPWAEARWKQFALRYRREMTKGTDSRQVIEFVSRLAEQTAIAIGCYCADETFCHRSLLRSLIEDASVTRPEVPRSEIP